MINFVYQHTLHYDFPRCVCVVPEGWNSLPLPSMGGAVAYGQEREPLLRLMPNYLYEFEYLDNGECGVVQLSIIDLLAETEGYQPSMKKVRIRTNRERFGGGGDGQFELMILHHLFGSYALSASMQNIYLDPADVFQWVNDGADFLLTYAISGKTEDALAVQLGQFGMEAGSRNFVMMFVDKRYFRLGYLSCCLDCFAGGATGESFVSDVAVESEKVFISLLSDQAILKHV